jgi:hypothetical protein
MLPSFNFKPTSKIPAARIFSKFCLTKIAIELFVEQYQFQSAAAPPPLFCCPKSIFPIWAV